MLVRLVEQFSTTTSLMLNGLFVKRADVTLVYSPPLPYSIAAAVIKLFKRTKTALNVQDLYPQTAIDLGYLNNRPARVMARLLEKFAYATADRIVVHSNGNRDQLLSQGVGENKIVVVPNWVDTDAITPGKRENPFRMEHNLQDHFVVSFAGVMGIAQGLDTVISAAQILKSNHRIKFLLAGDGANVQNIKQRVHDQKLDNVVIIPMQAREVYGELLRASDLCLVTLDSRLKTPVVPGKLQSIMAAGRPVMASVSDGGDVPKILNETGCGVVVDPSDPKAMADAILELTGKPGLLKNMGEAGRKYAEANYSKPRLLQQFIENISI